MLKSRSSYCFVVLFIAAGCGLLSAQAPPPDPILAPASSARDLTETEMLEIYGWMVGRRAGISRLGLNDDEMAAFVRGLENARHNREVEADLPTVGQEVSRFVQAKFAAHLESLQAAEAARAAAYWADLTAQEDVQVRPSGLAFKILDPGHGIHPTAVDTVRVQYTGRLIDGTVFDASEENRPFDAQLDQMIAGWTEGVPLIGEGGSIQLYIPADLGYGDSGSGPIPPGATLIFDVELIEVLRPAAAQP